MRDILTAGRVVVGTDGSATARHATNWAAMVATSDSLPLLLVCAVSPRSPLARMFASEEEHRTHAIAEAEQLLDAEKAHLGGLHPHLTVETAVRIGSPAGILVAATRDAELVVVGARGESSPVAVRTLGGFSDAVATHAQGPIAVVPEGAEDHDGPVVVGVDDALEARAAIRLGFQIAQRLGRQLEALHGYQYVVSRTRYYNKHTDELEAELAAEVNEIVAPIAAGYRGVEWHCRLIQKHPVWALVEASESANVAVLGSRGRGGFAGMLLGSTSREVLRNAGCPVFVVRAAK